MRKVQVTAGAQRAFEWFARNGVETNYSSLSFRIHRGSGNCVCADCQDARKKLDRIIRASKP